MSSLPTPPPPSVPPAASPAGAPSVLILGGCGFVGRHLVALLVERRLCSKVRVVDKLMPAMAALSEEHKQAFASPLVEYKQADLSRQVGVDKAFEGATFTFVFNLTFDGQASQFGQADEVYQQHVVDVSTRAGMAAQKHGAARFVELSTAQVYESTDKAATEAGKLKPWTKQERRRPVPPHPLLPSATRPTCPPWRRPPWHRPPAGHL